MRTKSELLSMGIPWCMISIAFTNSVKAMIMAAIVRWAKSK